MRGYQLGVSYCSGNNYVPAFNLDPPTLWDKTSGIPWHIFDILLGVSALKELLNE